jgi:cob(I)alamin adenosyltransferase
MKIYTRTGDRGETSLFGGRRVPKDDVRIETYGTVDELNSMLGVIRAMKVGRRLDTILHRIQEELFVLGADLATPARKGAKSIKSPRITPSHIANLEKLIDESDSKLSPLRHFLLPGGSPPAAYLHLARAICRRAERLAVRLARREPITPSVVIYLNRLSDLLFILARVVNKRAGAAEAEWRGRRG